MSVESENLPAPQLAFRVGVETGEETEGSTGARSRGGGTVYQVQRKVSRFGLAFLAENLQKLQMFQGGP
jgi:hypothetical protein